MSAQDIRGVLHRHEDGTEHRHFQEGFTIGGQVIADADGTEEHQHGTMTFGGAGDMKMTSGPVVWTEQHLTCVECGEPVWIEDNGVSHHDDSDLDLDHVAIPDELDGEKYG